MGDGGEGDTEMQAGTDVASHVGDSQAQRG